MVFRRLRSTDVREFRRFRLLALEESPTAFGSSYSEEANRPLSHFKRRIEINVGNWVFGAFEGQRLLGIVRLVRSDGVKERHKASIFSMYVDQESRRKGIAQSLLDTAMRRAKKLKGVRKVQLAVTTSNIAAIALYKKAGFMEYGREEEALFIADEFYSESLMARKL